MGEVTFPQFRIGQCILLPMGDGNAAFRLASNLKTAWLGSTCQGYGVSAYAN